MTYKVMIKKLHKDARLPEYAHPEDAGMDLFSLNEFDISPNKSALVSTGIAIQLPPRSEAQIRPRSGLALRHMITLLNAPGTIDAGYRGEIKVIMINHGTETFKVEKGVRIAQMVIKPIYDVELEEVDNLEDTFRGTGGFGSTGK